MFYVRNLIINFITDARHFQIVYLASFLLLGIWLLNWDVYYIYFSLFIGATLLTQWIGIFLTTKNYSSLKSAFITGLGLCLLCKTNLPVTAVFAAVLAIGSKFLIRYKNKHIFNPVNFGLVATMLITNDSWISPGQWSSHLIFFFAVGALGFLVLKKVNRLDISITFLLVFGGLQLIRNVIYLGWPMDFFIHQMTSGTLMLFTFFMITDPMTTPNHRTARILWTVILSVIAFLLSNFMYLYSAPIWTLFFMSPLVPLFDRVFEAKKYEWIHSTPKQTIYSLKNKMSIS